MAQSYTHAGRYYSQSRRERIERLDRLATLLDTAFVIPGTNIRFGADALIGLAPGIGDSVQNAFVTSNWLVAYLPEVVAVYRVSPNSALRSGAAASAS